MAQNPYAPPRSHVEDARTPLPDGEFIPGGRGVSAGNGWRWIADAWAFTGEQRWTFVGVFVLFALLAILMNIIPLLGTFVSTLLMPVFSGGFVLGCDAVRRGEPLEVGHLFAGFRKHAGKLIATGAISLAFLIIMVLVITAIFGSSIGMIFLGAAPTPETASQSLLLILLAALIMIALSLPLYMALWFACPLIVLADSEVGAALKTSFGACLKNVVPYLVWSVAVLVLAIPATIPIFLGWLVLGPVLMASIYLSYRDIFHEI
jgi:uncharacterized membrane protein